jgi:ribosomal protein RSM22 (predicted rRNA methylase)
VGIIAKLSSQSGDRTSASNILVAGRVLKEPALLAEIAQGVASTDAKLAGDCAEVMTMVAAKKPAAVAPFANALIARLDEKDTRVRWEVTHCLAEIAALLPDKIAPLVRRLDEKIALDKSVIVRDYAILALGEYGGTSPAAAQRVWPHLRQALILWEGKHASKALTAMQKLVGVDPVLKPDAQKIAQSFVDHKRASVRTAAKKLLKQG